MNINEKIVNYKYGLPCEANLCRITSMAPHYHSHSLEFIYCLEGQVTLVAGHQQVDIHAGEIFSVDFRDIHFLYSEQENLVLFFHLDLTALDMPWEYLRNVFFSCESSHCYPYQIPAMSQVKDIILSLSYLLHNEDELSDAESHINKAANKLLKLLLNYFNWYNYNNQDDHMNIESYNRFYRVLSYCNENYMNKISISKLAEMEHINVNYFSQFINKTVFATFRDMLKYIRCYEAEQLLLLTDLSVAEISYKCGFSDPKYFYSAFKQWWECTPTEHRNNYKEYMNTISDIEAIVSEEAASTIKEHLANWTLERTLTHN